MTEGHAVDLLIVGAGPAGLLASAIASTIGLTHRLIERGPGLHVHPSAHVVKTHSMEVYRRLGIADAINELATPASYQRCVTWCESVSGLVYGRLDLTGKKGPTPRFAAISPTYSANIPQNVLEPILADRVRTLGADIHVGEALVDYSQDDDGVTATIGGDSATQEVRCRYLIGADGAGSRVRRIAGIEIEGAAVLAQMLAIHIASDVRPFLDRNPGVLFFVRAPGLDGTFIMHQPVGSQVFMMRFDPEATPFESFDEARAAKIVRAGFGCDHRFEVTGIGRWTMSAQVATSYRQGRVLLVGDAAHRFPPTGGLGLNTGVEDVENLLWKLGAVLHGRASDALLDSYEVECRPIARRNTAQSVENAMRMSEVAKAIGADAGDAALAVALQALHDGDATGRFPIIQRAIDDQLKHFAHLQLEMAAAIEAGAFIPSARRVALPVPMVEEHQPSFLPGSYVPHLWLEPGISTIDQLRFDRFVLFAPSDAAAEWRAIATELAGGGYLPVDVVGLDGAMRSEQASAADFWGGEPYAILVRPDGCIAWIEPEDAAADRVRVLSDVLASIAPH